MKLDIVKVALISIFYYFFSLGSVQAAQKDNNFDPGGYNLKIVGNRIDYVGEDRLPNANNDLTSQGDGEEYTVSLARHHIIPYNRLRDFWNRLVENFNIARGNFRGVFLEIGDVRKYTHGMRLDCTNNQIMSYVQRTETFADALSDTTGSLVFHDPNSSREEPEGLRGFLSFYSWLPGNTFIGPSNRLDDPGFNFESNAAAVVGDENFRILQELNRLMQNYIEGEDVNINRLNELFTKIAKRKNIYPLNSNAWEKKDGSYRLRQDQSRLKRSAEFSDIARDTVVSSSSCDAITSEYKNIKIKYLSSILIP